MIRMLIVDDHPIVRKGLIRILDDCPDITSIDETSRGLDAISMASRNTYDIVMLDISLPDKDGLDVLMQIKAEKPETGVLVLSVHPEKRFAIRMLKAGASGYLTKDRVPSELVAAVKKVAAGGKYITTSLAEMMAVEMEQDDDRPVHERLSDREFQVMMGIASGQTVGQLADQLCLSVKTVSTYRTRVLKKTGLESNSKLISYAYMHGLVE